MLFKITFKRLSECIFKRLTSQHPFASQSAQVMKTYHVSCMWVWFWPLTGHFCVYIVLLAGAEGQNLFLLSFLSSHPLLPEECLEIHCPKRYYHPDWCVCFQLWPGLLWPWRWGNLSYITPSSTDCRQGLPDSPLHSLPPRLLPTKGTPSFPAAPPVPTASSHPLWVCTCCREEKTTLPPWPWCTHERRQEEGSLQASHLLRELQAILLSRTALWMIAAGCFVWLCLCSLSAKGVSPEAALVSRERGL